VTALRAGAQGDDPSFPPAWSALYQEEREKLRRLAVVTAPHLDWESAVEETFLEVLYQWETVRNPKAWLRQTLMNKLRDQGRKRSSPADLTEDYLRSIHGRYRFVLGGTCSDAQDALELRETLGALGKLDERLRQAILLRISGSSDDEIAEAMGCTKRTVQRYISDAFREITEAVGNQNRRPRGSTDRHRPGSGGV
jgi:RNA polymerase sigma factor (sigma-70 family)